jgi:hypothetical protein
LRITQPAELDLGGTVVGGTVVAETLGGGTFAAAFNSSTSFSWAVLGLGAAGAAALPEPECPNP